MECPWCHQVRYLRHWKYSHWAAWSAVTEEYNACRVCSATGVHTDAVEVMSTWTSLCVAYNYVATDVCLRSSLKVLVETWMDQVPGLVRKKLSYRGAIASRINRGKFFDPGNWTYYLGMKLMFPELLDKYAWNAKTCGDIFKAFLGYDLSTNDSIPGMHSFAKWLDCWFYHLYRFCILVQDRCWTIHTFVDCEEIALDINA